MTRHHRIRFPISSGITGTIGYVSSALIWALAGVVAVSAVSACSGNTSIDNCEWSGLLVLQHQIMASPTGSHIDGYVPVVGGPQFVITHCGEDALMICHVY